MAVNGKDQRGRREQESTRVAVAVARHTGQDEGEACHHAWSRLGILLQRGNSAILANRVPTHPGAPIDGQL